MIGKSQKWKLSGIDKMTKLYLNAFDIHKPLTNMLSNVICNQETKRLFI